ncbi:Dihydrolipoyllysine-residue acetyltransferase component of pyruvate dehydrogenase complex [Dirofilaria immitis]
MKPFHFYIDLRENHGKLSKISKGEGAQYATTIEANRMTGHYPEHVEVGFPALSPTMHTGKLAKWHKQVGDRIIEGDLLCEIETDKSVMAFETTEEGFLAKIIIPEGTHGIRIGEPLCVICENKDDISAFSNYVPIAAVITAHSPIATTGTYPSIVATASHPSVVDTTTRPSVVDTAARSPETISTSVAPSTTSASSIPASFAVPPISAHPRAGNRIVATPHARKLATDLGINLSNIQGTGLDGHITETDVEGAKLNKIVPNSTIDKKSVESGKPKKEAKQVAHDQPKYKDIPLTNMRETIAKRLSFSKQTIPHYYLTSEIKMDELLKVRANLNAKMKDQGVKVSINDFVIKACALACMDVPEANSFFLEKEKVIRQNLTADVSVAVKTETGLITPIVYNADVKGLIEISSEIKQLADKAQQNKLKPSEYMGGTFTVSNLGMFGSIHHFTAIINPPQSCILAVGGAEYKVVPDDSGTGFKAITTMLVTMSCDHRVVDGAVGAIWLKHFKEYMEKPETMLKLNSKEKIESGHFV